LLTASFNSFPPEVVEALLACCAEQARHGAGVLLEHPPKNEVRPNIQHEGFCMAAAPDDLCTVNDLAAWLPNYNHNDDVNLQNLITYGSLQILTYLNRPHLLASAIGPLNETYDGNDSDRLLPHFFPIISVASVTVDGVSVSPSIQPSVAGFLWDSRRVLLRGYVFKRGVQNVQVAYTAGYSALPLDLKQAAIEAFALAYRQRTHIGEKSNSMGGQVTLGFDMSDVPDRSLAVFNQYRRIAL
jgi:hypothetical protein